MILCGRSQMKILWVNSKEIILCGWSWMGVLLHNANGWMRVLVGGASCTEDPSSSGLSFSIQFNLILNQFKSFISISGIGWTLTHRLLAKDPSSSGLSFSIQFNLILIQFKSLTYFNLHWHSGALLKIPAYLVSAFLFNCVLNICFNSTFNSQFEIQVSIKNSNRKYQVPCWRSQLIRSLFSYSISF